MDDTKFFIFESGGGLVFVCMRGEQGKEIFKGGRVC